jgi:hypothetical protein
MGGMGGMGGGRPGGEDRERQTWLTEDEAVWGTKVGAVSSVIGRPEDADEPDEELVVLGPVRGARPEPRSGAKPRTREDQAARGSSTPDARNGERDAQQAQDHSS